MKIKLLLFLHIYTLILYGQVNDLVKTDGIFTEIHRNNVGKIVFMSSNIPLEKCKNSDFLEKYELNENSNLNIRVFLANSITNYMHNLAPELTEEELNQKGNYQFSFIVDNKLIYKENIHFGCGLKKSTTTTYRVPFTDTTGADWWSIYLFDRFKVNGGDQALSIGEHELAVEIRPYLKRKEEEEEEEEEEEVLVGDIIAKGSLFISIKEKGIKQDQIDIQDINEYNDLEISSDGYNKDLIMELNKKIAENSFKYITSMVVLKDGKILLEEYFNKANRNTLHDTRSVGKSLTSTLMGMAINDGYIKNEFESINSFYKLKNFQHHTIKKDHINLKHLLTMTSCFDGSDNDSDSPGNEEFMYPTNNWVKFALDLPTDSTKTNGSQWAYFTAGVVLLGDILNMVVPGGLEKYAEQKLFKPLNIREYRWQYTPQNVVNTAGGLQMSALDYAKFGQLYKNNGRWENQQLISEHWVKKSLYKHIQIPERENEFYGFLFWNKTYNIKGINYETYYCAGNGGNKIFIFKDVPFVIVITATAYNRPYGHEQVDKMMQEYILPALLN